MNIITASSKLSDFLTSRYDRTSMLNMVTSLVIEWQLEKEASCFKKHVTQPA